MMLQVGKLSRVGSFGKLVFCNERRLNFGNAWWYNEVLEKTGAYPVLGVKKMCVEAGLFVIGELVLQSCNIFQEQFKHSRRRVIVFLIYRVPLTAFKYGITYMNRIIFGTAYRQKGHDVQKAKKQEAGYGSPLLS